MISGKIITANNGDDTLTIIDRVFPNNNETINLKHLLMPSEEDSKYKKIAKVGPSDLIIDRFGKLLVINSLEDSLIRLDLESKDILGIAHLGRCPISIKVFDGKIIIINCDSNSVTVLDEKSLLTLETFYIGGKPTDLCIDNRTSRIYVTNSDEYSVSVINPVGEEIEKIKLDSQPIKIVLEGNYIYTLTHINNGVTNYSKLIVIELDDYKIVWSKELKGIYYDFLKVVGEDYFYLINPEDGYLYGLSKKDGILKKRVYLGGLPNRIVANDHKEIYANDLVNHQIIIMDIVKDKVIEKIKVGKEPQGILLL